MLNNNVELRYPDIVEQISESEWFDTIELDAQRKIGSTFLMNLFEAEGMPLFRCGYELNRPLKWGTVRDAFAKALDAAQASPDCLKAFEDTVSHGIRSAPHCALD